MTSTVYLLGGAFSNLELNNYMPSQLGGAITNGNNAIIVPYNTNGLFRNVVEQGAALLNTYLLAGTGPMVAFGHSLGAVVCNYWLANYAPTTTISPADLSFVWIGNSVSVYGGALGPESGAWLENWFGSGVTAPAATSFTCTSIARQYDGWADWPTGTFNIDAEYNALAGQGVIHPNYQMVNPSPTAPGNVHYTPAVGGSPGNITYIWSLTDPVPALGTSLNPISRALDATLRPTIESAYSRPVTIPSPGFALTADLTVTPTFSAHMALVMPATGLIVTPTFTAHLQTRHLAGDMKVTPTFANEFMFTAQIQAELFVAPKLLANNDV